MITLPEQTERMLAYFGKTTNRSKDQTIFLYELCDRDFIKLTILEERIANAFISYCPGTKQEVEFILDACIDSRRVSFREWRIQVDGFNLKWQDGQDVFFTSVPKGENRRDVIDNRRGHEWIYHYDVPNDPKKPDYYREQGVEINIINGQITLLTNNMKMTIHKTLECPFCHLTQKAELFGEGDNLNTAVVENIQFQTCRHYVFARDTIKDILTTDKPHPKETSKDEKMKLPPPGRLYARSDYHNGAGQIVDYSTYIFMFGGEPVDTYQALTKEETDLLTSGRKLII